jgi:hypothetical protein
MSNRMDIKSWRKSRNGKAYAIRIGSTWTNDKGVTYLEFDALPLPDEQGRVSCFLEEPRERAEPGVQSFAQTARGGTTSSNAAKPIPLGGDEIPF